MKHRRIFFSVGEPSGDLHASNLILDFKNQRTETDFEFFGFGGPKMASAGCQLLEDMTQHAVMFLSGIFSKIAKFRNLLKQAEAVFREQQVDLVVLIDYSGFNWHVARLAKKHGISVVFYGIPQMWAWAPWRVRKMRRFVDLGICKLPFEEKWLRDRNCEAEFVGHPFFDEMQRQTIEPDFVAEYSKKLNGRDLVALLPGSRKQELSTNLPVFLKTANLLHQARPETEFAISCLDQQQMNLALEIIKKSPFAEFANRKVTLTGGKTPEMIKLAKCCLACSGSVSLELMYRETPTVIHYRLPWQLYGAQKLFLRVRYITLVNLLWSDSIVREKMRVYDPDDPSAENIPFPEYLTFQDKSEQMKGQLLKLLDDQEYYNEKKSMLSSLKARFGQTGASERAVQVICDRFFSDSKGDSRKPQAA